MSAYDTPLPGFDPSDPGEDALSIIQAQYHVAGSIYGSANPVDILKALSNFVGNVYEQAHLTLIADPGAHDRLTIIAERVANSFQAAARGDQLENYPAYEALPALETLYAPDVSTEPFISPEERATLLQKDVVALLLVPLVINTELRGIIFFADSNPQTISAARLRAMRGLGDQVAVVLENRSLLRTARANLDEVQTLYNVNRALLEAQDTLSVVRTLRDFLSPEAGTIAHLQLKRDSQGAIQRVVIRHLITPDNEGVYDLPIPELQDPQMLDLFDDVYRDRGTPTVSVVEDSASTNDLLPFTRFARTRQARAYIAINIVERDKLQSIIGVMYNETRRFAERERRLYNAVANQMTVVLQNQRLLQESQTTAARLAQQVRVLGTVNEIVTELGSITDEKRLLDRAIERTIRTLEVDTGSIMLLDDARMMGTVISEAPSPEQVGTVVDLSGAQGIQQIHREPLLVTSYGIQRLPEDLQRMMTAADVQQLLLAGLIVSGDLIGIMLLSYTRKQREFTNATIEFAETLAAQIALSLQNIRLLSQAQRRAEQLQQISDFGQALQTTLDLEGLLETTVTEAARILHADQITVTLYESESQVLRVIAQYIDQNPVITLTGGASMSPRTDFIRDAWERGELVYVDDVYNLRAARREREDDIRSVLIAPIRVRGVQRGIVSVGSFAPNVFGSTEVTVFQQMISQFGVALENTEALAQSQRQATNEALINEISTRFQQQRDIEDMLKLTMNSLSQALGARRARIRMATQPPPEYNEDGEGA